MVRREMAEEMDRREWERMIERKEWTERKTGGERNGTGGKRKE